MLTFKENESFHSEVQTQLLTALYEAGGDAASYLQDRLSYHSTSGVHWGEEYPNWFGDSNPNRSSAYGEYPQEQSGSLAESVGVEDENDLAVQVGFFGEDQAKLEYLEFLSSELHDEEKNNGARRPLWMTFEGENSTEVHDIMNEAIERNG